MPDLDLLALGLWLIPWPFIASAGEIPPIGRAVLAFVWPLLLAMLAIVAALTVILDWFDQAIFGEEDA